MPRLTVTALVLAIVSPAGASAQSRPAVAVTPLSEGTLQSLVYGSRTTVQRCARRGDSPAYVAEVRVRVRPGRAPATLYHSPLSVTVRSRPRDGAFESCVRRSVRDSVRHQPYAVPRTVSARATFQIAARPEPRPPTPPPAYSESAAQQTLRAAGSRLRRCLETAGLPGGVTLQVAVEANGRMTLMNAQIPGGITRHALPCLSRTVSSLRVRSRPPRRMRLTHTLRL